jgi:hypothetical protein
LPETLDSRFLVDDLGPGLADTTLIVAAVAVAREATIQYYAWCHNLRQFVALVRRSTGAAWLSDESPSQILRTVESRRAVNGLRVSLEVCASVIRADRADGSHGAGVIEGTLDRIDRDRCAEPIAFAWRCLQILRENLTDSTMAMTRLVLTASEGGGKRTAPLALFEPDAVEDVVDLAGPCDVSIQGSVDGVIELIDAVTTHLANLEMDLRDLHHRKRTIRRKR